MNVYGVPGTDGNVEFHVDKLGDANDGRWWWRYVGQYFEFENDILMKDNEKLMFDVTGDYINNTDDNLTANSVSEIRLNSGTDVMLNPTGEDIILAVGGTAFGYLSQNASDKLTIKSANQTDALEFLGWANIAALGDVTVNGNIVGDADEAKAIFAATTSNTITIGGVGSTVATAGDLTVAGTVTANTSLLPDAVGGADIGSVDAEWGNVFIADDKKIQFGDGQDASIEYDADGSSQLRFAGAAAIFEQAVTFSGGIANGGTITTTDIDGGSIDGTVIGAVTQAAGDFTAIGAVTPGTIVGTTITVNDNIAGDADENKIIFEQTATPSNTITIGGGGLTVAGGDLKVTGNDIQNSEGEATITMDADQNATIAADLTVTGADIVVGADADNTDRSITFGHSTVKTIMGLDDDQDVFAIHTNASFEADNDIEIAADGGVTFNLSLIHI